MLMLPSRVRLRSNVLRRERSALLAKGSRAVPVQAIFRGYIARRDDRLLGVSSVAVAGVGVGVVVVGVGVGDEVVLIGEQGGETIFATELAQKAGTIAWEVFTNISERVSRVYVH